MSNADAEEQLRLKQETPAEPEMSYDQRPYQPPPGVKRSRWMPSFLIL